MSCKLPDALLNAVAAAAKYSAHPEGPAAAYREALRANMVAGGDSCSRAIVIGALLGAQVSGGGEGALHANMVAGGTRAPGLSLSGRCWGHR